MEKIFAALTIEVMGKPVEYVNESLRTLVTRMGAEKGVKIVNKAYHEPISVEGSKDLFTTFAEVEMEFDAPSNYFFIIFSYMPSHVEIIRPENFHITNFDLNELSNALVQRLHGYDAVTKNTLMEKELLMKKLKEVAPHLFNEELARKKTKELERASKSDPQKEEKI
jgi:hypothetical protein